MTRYYLDTSVAVHALNGDRAAMTWFDDAAARGALISSRLLQTELTRVLRREGRPVLDREHILMQVDLVPVNDGVLTMAEAIQQHVKTLDSIHLATALRLGSAVVVASHDLALLRIAADLGLRTHDPLDDVIGT